MTKKFYSLIILAFLSIFLLSGPVTSTMDPDKGAIHSDTSIIDTEQPVVDFFYDLSCESCLKILPYMQDFSKNNPGIRIAFHDIEADPKNYELFKQFTAKTQQEKIYVPVVFIGDSYLQGDISIKDSFQTNLDVYLKNRNGSRFEDNTVEKSQIPKTIPEYSSANPAVQNNQVFSGIQFFYSPSCSACHKILPFIQDYAEKHPGIISFHDLSGNRSTFELFEQYRSRFPQNLIHIPVVFIGSTYLEGEANISESLNATIEEYLKDHSAIAGSEPENAEKLDTTINPVLLLVAAIGEGLNPCGLLVLALLLVSLMASGTRKMVLFVGIAYITAFFLVRLLSGFALFSVIQLPGISQAFLLVAAVIAILAGLIQIKDGLLREQKPRLSIPTSKKGVISTYMKKASIPGGFIVGVLVGIYGMSCTVGIYISILGMLYKDLTSGLFYLVVYNGIVIIPLIAILLLVFFGIPPEKVNAWREERKSQLRLATGIIMVLMGIIILIPML